MPAEDIRHPEKQLSVLKEVGKNIKDRRGRDGAPSQEGSLKKRFPNTRKHSQCQVCGEPWNHRGQHNQEEK